MNRQGIYVYICFAHTFRLNEYTKWLWEMTAENDMN